MHIKLREVFDSLVPGNMGIYMCTWVKIWVESASNCPISLKQERSSVGTNSNRFILWIHKLTRGRDLAAKDKNPIFPNWTLDLEKELIHHTVLIPEVHFSISELIINLEKWVFCFCWQGHFWHVRLFQYLYYNSWFFNDFLEIYVLS